MRTITLAAALAVAAPLAAQGSPDTVRLRFGWQPGMEARVEYQSVRGRSTEPKAAVLMASTYRMVVEESPRGLMVRSADLHWTELSDELGPMTEMLRGMEGLSADPSSVVSREGEFLGVMHVAEMRAQMETALEPMLAELDGAPQVREMLLASVSEEQLTGSAAAEWNTMVGFWAGADLEVGAVYVLQDTMRVPMFDIELPSEVEFSVAERVPCVEGQAARACVRLEMTTVPNTEALAEFIETLIASFSEDGELGEEFDMMKMQLDVRTRVTLVTEPGTLRPHRMEIEKISTAGADGVKFQQSEVETHRFTYTP